jgi:hypothetical protein
VREASNPSSTHKPRPAHIFPEGIKAFDILGDIHLLHLLQSHVSNQREDTHVREPVFHRISVIASLGRLENPGDKDLEVVLRLLLHRRGAGSNPSISLKAGEQG